MTSYSFLQAHTSLPPVCSSGGYTCAKKSGFNIVSSPPVVLDPRIRTLWFACVLSQVWGSRPNTGLHIVVSPREGKTFPVSETVLLLRQGRLSLGSHFLCCSSSFIPSASALILNSLLPKHPQVGPSLLTRESSTALTIFWANGRPNPSFASYLLNNLGKVTYPER